MLYIFTNFGTVLAVWDRMLKCLVLSSTAYDIKVGLHEKVAQHNTIKAIYLSPISRSYRECLKSIKRLL